MHSRLEASADHQDWKEIDRCIRHSIHHLRLYSDFEDAPSYRVHTFCDAVLESINAAIVQRNTMLSSTETNDDAIQAIENDMEHGPLGIVLVIARIRECKSCRDENDGFKTPPNAHVYPQFAPMCNSCHSHIANIVVSDECDTHAPWRCPFCRSVDIKSILLT